MEAAAFEPLSLRNNGTNARWQRRKTALCNIISIFLLNIFSIQTRVTTPLRGGVEEWLKLSPLALKELGSNTVPVRFF